MRLLNIRTALLFAIVLVGCKDQVASAKYKAFKKSEFESVHVTSVETERRHEKAKFLQGRILIGKDDKDRADRLNEYLKNIYSEFEKLFRAIESESKEGDDLYYVGSNETGVVGYILVRDGLIIQEYALARLVED